MAESVVNTRSHPIDLEDGRSLAPGELAEVDVKSDFNRQLLDSGVLRKRALKKPAPKTQSAPPAAPEPEEKE